MPVRKADARWEGSLKEGKGSLRLKSGALEAPYSFSTRFEDQPGTNPEELIGAALAACYSMALAAGLGKAGYQPQKVETSADVHLEKSGEGFAIARIALRTEASVADIDEDEFNRIAEATKSGCPVSKALGGTTVELDAKLLSMQQR